MTKIKYVIASAGHGGVLKNLKAVTSGKRSPDGKYIEGENNRKFVRALDIYLSDKNCVLLQDLVGNCPMQISLKDRVKTANMFDSENSIFLDIHSNAMSNKWTEHNGCTVFYYKWSKNGKRLAQCISDRLSGVGGIKSRGIKASLKFYVLRKTKMPSVIIERFFHTNKSDLKKGIKHIDDQASAVAHGVKDYFNG